MNIVVSVHVVNSAHSAAASLQFPGEELLLEGRSMDVLPFVS